MIDVKSCKKIELRGQEVKKIVDSLGRTLYEVSGPGPTPGDFLDFTGASVTPGGTIELAITKQLGNDQYVKLSKMSYKFVKGAGNLNNISWYNYPGAHVDVAGNDVSAYEQFCEYQEPTWDTYIEKTSSAMGIGLADNIEITQVTPGSFGLETTEGDTISFTTQTTIISSNEIRLDVINNANSLIIFSIYMKDFLVESEDIVYDRIAMNPMDLDTDANKGTYFYGKYKGDFSKYSYPANKTVYAQFVYSLAVETGYTRQSNYYLKVSNSRASDISWSSGINCQSDLLVQLNNYSPSTAALAYALGFQKPIKKDADNSYPNVFKAIDSTHIGVYESDGVTLAGTYTITKLDLVII